MKKLEAIGIAFVVILLAAVIGLLRHVYQERYDAITPVVSVQEVLPEQPPAVVDLDPDRLPAPEEWEAPRAFYTRRPISDSELAVVRACPGVATAWVNDRYTLRVFRGKLFTWKEINPCVEEAIQ